MKSLRDEIRLCREKDGFNFIQAVGLDFICVSRFHPCESKDFILYTHTAKDAYFDIRLFSVVRQTITNCHIYATNGIEIIENMCYDIKKRGDCMGFFGPIWDVICRLFSVASNAFQPFEVNITDVECVMDKPPVPDGECGYIGGSHAQFRLEIINRKNKKFILSDIHCKAMCRSELLRDRICCCDKNSYKNVAAVRVYEPITTLDIEPQSSRSCDIRLSLGGDLSQCDKLVFYYKPDFKYRKIVVWKQ